MPGNHGPAASFFFIFIQGASPQHPVKGAFPGVGFPEWVRTWAGAPRWGYIWAERERQWRTWFASRSLAAAVSPPGRCKHRPLHRRGGFHIRPGRLRLPQASAGSPLHDLREMPTHFPRGRVLSARLRAGRARPLRRRCGWGMRRCSVHHPVCRARPACRQPCQK